MSDFRNALRTELVAAAARPVREPVLRRARPVLALAAVAAAAVLAFALPGGVGERAEHPANDAPPTLPGRPLFEGGLQAGVRYRTQNLRPAISFRAPDGHWIVGQAMRSDLLELARVSPPTKPAPLRFLAFGRLPRVTDPHTGATERAPVDIASWLRAHPDLHVHTVRTTRALGQPAMQIDFTVSNRPARDAPWCWERRQVHCAQLAPDVVVWAGSATRAIVLDSGPDPLIVMMTSLDPSKFPRIIEESKPLLDSTRVAR